jgi:hypothetical protein
MAFCNLGEPTTSVPSQRNIKQRQTKIGNPNLCEFVQVAMSRAHIRRQPLSSYQRAYEMIGLQDRCVNGPTDPSESWSLTQPYEVVGGHADLPLRGTKAVWRAN